MISWTLVLTTLKKAITSKYFWMAVHAGIMIYIFLQWRSTIIENQRLSGNNTTLLEEVNSKDNQIGELLLTQKEFATLLKNDSVLNSHLKDSLKIKVKQVKEITQLYMEAKAKVLVQWKDTVLYDTKYDTLYMTRCFNWSDEYLKLTGCSIFAKTDTIELTYSSTDNISIVMYWDKPGRWFFPRLFQKRQYETAVVNSNPYNNLIINSKIKIQKR